MKYKKRKLSISINLQVLPNKSERWETVYSCNLVNKPIWIVRKLLNLLDEWYPENKKKASHKMHKEL